MYYRELKDYKKVSWARLLMKRVFLTDQYKKGGLPNKTIETILKEIDREILKREG